MCPSGVPIPAVASQSTTNKRCVVCVESGKYEFLVTPRFLGFMRLGKADIGHDNIRQGVAIPRLS